MFPVEWELWELEASDCPKILVFGTTNNQAVSGISKELIVRFSSRSFTLKATESGPKSKIHCVPLSETVKCIALIVKERVVS